MCCSCKHQFHRHKTNIIKKRRWYIKHFTQDSHFVNLHLIFLQNAKLKYKIKIINGFIMLTRCLTISGQNSLAMLAFHLKSALLFADYQGSKMYSPNNLWFYSQITDYCRRKCNCIVNFEMHWQIYLLEANVIGILSEALTAHVQSILSDQSMPVWANSAKKKTKAVFSTKCISTY